MNIFILLKGPPIPSLHIHFLQVVHILINKKVNKTETA